MVPETDDDFRSSDAVGFISWYDKHSLTQCKTCSREECSGLRRRSSFLFTASSGIGSGSAGVLGMDPTNSISLSESEPDESRNACIKVKENQRGNSITALHFPRIVFVCFCSSFSLSRWKSLLTIL